MRRFGQRYTGMANRPIRQYFQDDSAGTGGWRIPLEPAPSGGVGQMPLRACLVHGLGQFLGQNLAELVDRDVVARRKLPNRVAAEHRAELVGRDRQVLAVAEPGFDLVTEAGLLELRDDCAEAALIVAAEHLVQHRRQDRGAELAERAAKRRIVFQRVQNSHAPALSQAVLPPRLSAASLHIVKRRPITFAGQTFSNFSMTSVSAIP